jgi:hypothetical protein
MASFIGLMLAAGGVKLKARPPGIATRQQVLATHGLRTYG